ncbi:hypothetical protein QOZ80_8AG0616280 [Eleusine coracana subsp. coracana]|nr:hypothetical protein QOZ80_8AG0616280 [Eleusine coracana subsp. coracana]
MPSGGRRVPPWTSPRSAGGLPPRWSPGASTPAGASGTGHGTPGVSGGGWGARATPPTSGGGCDRVTPPASGGGRDRVTPPSTGGWSSRPPRPPATALDSPYVRAKQAQLIEKDPNKAVPLFWAAINSGDRIESALKDMANVLKQANRSEEAIEAIRSFRDHCPYDAQDSLDNILLDLYKKCGRTEEQIEMLTMKLRIVDEELASGRWKTKLSKSHGRGVYLSLKDEKARLLGNLAWAYMQSENYEEAEMHYRQALAIEADYNKECNLAICLMRTGKLAEAKYLLQAIPYNSDDESHVKSLSRATEMLRELELQSLPSPITQVKCKESRIVLAADVEKLEDLQLETLSTPLTKLKYEEPHFSVSAEREKHEDCNSWLPSPITQLKREEPHTMVTAGGEKNEDSGEYQDLSRLFNDAATPQSILEKLRKRLVKEAPITSTHDQIQTPAPNECMPNPKGTTDANENSVQERKQLTKGVKKSWADMVDEDEQQLGDEKAWDVSLREEKMRLGDEKPTVGMGRTDQNECSEHGSKLEHKTPSSSSQGIGTFQRPFAGDHLHNSSAGSWRHGDSKISTDKNVNWELVRTAPMWRHNKAQDYSNRVCHKPNTVHLNENASGTKQAPWRSSASQRELFPDCKSKCDRYGHGFLPFRDSERTQCYSHTEATHRSHNDSSSTPWRPQSRLRVFQEITNEIKQNVA